MRVVDPSGRPVRDAVVALYPVSRRSPRPHAGGRYVVSQQNLQFHPFLTIVPVGADVSFPNLDPTKHHVYSFSAAKRFELKLFAKDQSRTVHFDKPGVVALGCNIHDQMSAFIFVTDSAWTARTNAQGWPIFGDAPNSAGRLTVWHPYLRSPGGLLQQAVAPGQRSATFSFGFVRPRRRCRWIIDPMRPFRSLSARLTFQFALLFAGAMLVVSAALSTFIAGAASREVESQLQSSGAVYDRLWQQRAHELQNAAQLLARDFGFRAAVATGDEATMQSALGNAAARLKVRTAFIVTADGKVSAIDPSIGNNELRPVGAARRRIG